MDEAALSINASQLGALHSQELEVTVVYAVLCTYLAVLTAFLGWWARFPR